VVRAALGAGEPGSQIVMVLAAGLLTAGGEFDRRKPIA
jgi:hypothetical protein